MLWRTTISLVCLVLFVISCSGTSKKAEVDTAVNRAVAWVERHPASFKDGTFIEIAEEIVAFYILRDNAKDEAKKKEYLKQIKKRLELVASNTDFRVKPSEYTMYLCVDEISKTLGLSIVDFGRTIEKQILPDPELYPARVTTGIWNTVFLKKLGYKPPKPLNELMPNSTLAKELKQQMLLRLMQPPVDRKYVKNMNATVYNITHEVFALTDLGRLPPPPIVRNNRSFFLNLLDRTIEWGIREGMVDMVAELIMSAKMLGFDDMPSLKKGIDFIVSRQQADGSFGITNPGRPNVRRHGVLVSVMALSLI